MDEKIRGVLLASILCIMTFVSVALFSMSGIKLSQFLTINPLPLFSAIASLYFILCLFTTSLSIATLLFIAKKYYFKFALLLSLPPFIIGALGGILVFGVYDFALPIVLAAISIPWALMTLTSAEEELKMFKIFRSGAAAGGKIILVASLVFFCYLLFVSYQQKSTFEETFASDILSITSTNGQALSQNLQGPLVTLSISSQQQLLAAIEGLPQYTKLTSNNNVDDQSFVAAISAIDTQLKSPAYRAQIEAQAQKVVPTDTSPNLIKNIPIIQQIGTYLWLLYPIEALIMCLFIGNLLIRNCAAGLYFIICLIFTKGKQPTPTPKAAP